MNIVESADQYRCVRCGCAGISFSILSLLSARISLGTPRSTIDFGSKRYLCRQTKPSLERALNSWQSWESSRLLSCTIWHREPTRQCIIASFKAPNMQTYDIIEQHRQEVGTSVSTYGKTSYRTARFWSQKTKDPGNSYFLEFLVFVVLVFWLVLGWNVGTLELSGMGWDDNLQNLKIWSHPSALDWNI